MNITIPTRLKSLLSKDQVCETFTLSCITTITPWFALNNTTFFPEYTDHGIQHINDVLLSSDSIITDSSWDVMTAQDAAAIIVATLLHDSAMHLTEDGFYTLINGQYSEIKSRYLKTEPPWAQLWDDFIKEAKRFDSKKLVSLFGSSNPINDIPKEKIDLTGRDRLLIGEFLRRHHARLAHEIAFNGIPGVNGNNMPLVSDWDDNFLDLCGFIARSHNMGLRESVDCIVKEKQQVHLRVHTPFIMLVLRISDYIQIHAERANNSLLQIKQIVSPISRGEWAKHNSIIDITHAHTDPEALYVDAEPRDAIIFSSLSYLFKSIQTELDQCWSVLGEVYGRWKEFQCLGINIRRIRSSLDDINSFIKNKRPDYIPKTLSFKTENSEMVELLIAPLYGDRPEFGVRELLQNSVDACIELQDLIIKNKVNINERCYECDVEALLINTEDACEFKIIDHGIGMTIDIIEDYFLNIGASFRNSDNWKKNHLNNGHSTVHRTGRFGIGLLSAYLLGDEINVITRHISEPENKGLQFKCKKDSEHIEIKNVTADFGTTISIKISKEVANTLANNTSSWDWFCGKDILVKRKVETETGVKELSQQYIMPSCNGELPENWYRTSHTDYDDIIWTYEKLSKRQYGYDRYLFCNSIYVSNDIRFDDFNLSEELGIIKCSIPQLIIYDQDGRLPLNLERTSLNSRAISFKEQLYGDIADYYVEQVKLNFDQVKGDVNKDIISKSINPNILGSIDSYYYSEEKASKYIISDNILIPFDFNIIPISDNKCDIHGKV